MNKTELENRKRNRDLLDRLLFIILAAILVNMLKPLANIVPTDDPRLSMALLAITVGLYLLHFRSMRVYIDEARRQEAQEREAQDALLYDALERERLARERSAIIFRLEEELHQGTISEEGKDTLRLLTRLQHDQDATQRTS